MFSQRIMSHDQEMFGKQCVTLSVAQVAAIQDDLYRLLDSVSSNPIATARIQNLIKQFDSHSTSSEETVREIEEDQAYLSGYSTLMIQAQRQCQQ